MRVYKLDSDLEFQSLWPLTDTDHDILLDFDGRSWSARWAPMRVTRYTGEEAKQNRQLSDFPSLRRNAPVFSRRAVEGLWDLLDPHGEILPLLFDGADFFVYNVTTVSGALDEGRSEISRYDDGQVLAVYQYGFRLEQLGEAPIFKLIQIPRQHPFVTEEFVKRVRELRLTGFVFKLVWEG